MGAAAPAAIGVGGPGERRGAALRPALVEHVQVQVLERGLGPDGAGHAGGAVSGEEPDEGRSVPHVVDVDHARRGRQLIRLPSRDAGLPDHAVDARHDLRRGAPHYQGPRPHHQDAVGYALNVGDDVRGQQDDLVGGEARDEVAEPHPLLRVEAGGGLVEHEDVRVVEHRLGDTESPLHATGKRPDEAALLAGEPDPVEQLERARACRAGVQALQGGHVLHEVERRELRVVPEVLGEVAEARPELAPHLRGRAPVEADLARGRAQDAAYHAHDRRLPRAVGAEQPVDAGPQPGADPVDRDLRAVLLGEPIELEFHRILPSIEIRCRAGTGRPRAGARSPGLPRPATRGPPRRTRTRRPGKRGTRPRRSPPRTRQGRRRTTAPTRR